MKIWKLLKAFLPSKLPIGVTEFEMWVDDFMSIYPMPTSDKDSILFTLSSIMIHLGPTCAYKSKYFFYLTLHAAATKQIAGQIFYDIKTKQKLAIEKLKESLLEAPQSSE